ncbi:MAG: hypothetical protein ACREUU_02210, partial [Gammaproteobacteria bacterium]
IVGGDQDVVLTMAGVPGVEFTVFARSVTFPDGSKVGRLSLSQVHADKVPMPPPNGTAPRLVGTLQPAGIKFDPPIRVQIPNTENLKPGQVIEFVQFDHDLEQFVSVGTARATEDGAFIVTDPGFGITKSGWHGPECRAAICTGPANAAWIAPPCQKFDPFRGYVPNADRNGFSCPNAPESFTLPCGNRKIQVRIDSSCRGQCSAGACLPMPFSTSTVKDAITKAVAKVCDGCIGEQNLLRSNMQNVLTGIGVVVRCRDELSGNPGACAESNPFDPRFNVSNTIWLAARTFVPRTVCNSVPLESLFLHEFVHGSGSRFDEETPTGCQAACFAPVTVRDPVTGLDVVGRAANC